MRRTLRYVALVAALALTSLSMPGCAAHPARKQDSQAPQLGLYLYDSLVFEIAPMREAIPDPLALDFFVERMHKNRICHRDRVVITVSPSEPLVPPFPMTMHTVIWFDKTHRRLKDTDLSDRRGYIFVSYLTGPIFENGQPRMLGGVQYDKDAFAVIAPGSREGAILLHEMGHILGLVDKREGDPKHPRHCRNRDCVMYYTVISAYSDYDEDCKKRIGKLIKNARREE